MTFIIIYHLISLQSFLLFLNNWLIKQMIHWIAGLSIQKDRANNKLTKVPPRAPASREQQQQQEQGSCNSPTLPWNSKYPWHSQSLLSAPSPPLPGSASLSPETGPDCGAPRFPILCPRISLRILNKNLYQRTLLAMGRSLVVECGHIWSHWSHLEGSSFFWKFSQ